MIEECPACKGPNEGSCPACQLLRDKKARTPWCSDCFIKLMESKAPEGYEITALSLLGGIQCATRLAGEVLQKRTTTDQIYIALLKLEEFINEATKVLKND